MLISVFTQPRLCLLGGAVRSRNYMHQQTRALRYRRNAQQSGRPANLPLAGLVPVQASDAAEAPAWVNHPLFFWLLRAHSQPHAHRLPPRKPEIHRHFL